MKKTQILYIHGGMTFKNRKDYLHFLKTRKIYLDRKPNWSDDYFNSILGKTFEIIRPRMPFKENAKYEEWKINFERYIPYLRKDMILIGESLGGIFLAQYLSENKLPIPALSVFIICAPFDDTVKGEDLVGGFRLKSDLSLLPQNTKNLYLMFSADDDCVPVSHAEKYRSKLGKFLNTKIIIYKSKNGHFQISKFPEIVKMIKADVKAA